jgi:vitamin B12 transporter
MTTAKRTLILSGLTMLGSVCACGADRVCGRTVDPAALPVAGVRVTLYSRETGAQIAANTDAVGKYCFEGVARGEYLLEASAPPLGMASPQPLTIGDAETNLADLQLALNPVSSQVTVTGSGFAQSASETSKELEVVDAGAASAEGNDFLIAAVSELPGVRVSQAGGPGSFANIQIRGLRSFDTSILVDGMRLRDVSATQGDASSFLSDLFFGSADRVEVLEGAGASLYGTNAIGGVVNVVTDHGGGPFHGDVDVQGGMLGQFLGKVHLAGGALGNRLSYSMGFGHYDVTKGVQGNGPYRSSGGAGFVEFAPRSGVRIGARILASGVYGELEDDPAPLPPNSNPTEAIAAMPLPVSQIPAAVTSLANGIPYSFGNATFIPGYGDPDNYRTVLFFSTLLYLEQQAAPSFHYRISFQDLPVYRNYVNGPLGLGSQPSERTATQYNSRADTLNAAIDWRPLHGQLISAGYEFERESYSSPSYIGQTPMLFSNTSAGQSSHTGFLQDQTMLFGDRLQISLSGRWQAFDLAAPVFSLVDPVYAGAPALSPPSAKTGDASIAYFFRSTGTKLRSHVGKAYRAPSLYERFGTYFDGNTFLAYGDPRLSPERAVSLDAGFDQYFLRDTVKIGASYFYTHLQETIAYDPGNLITPATDPYGRFGGYYNTPGGLARGVELSAEARLPGRIVLRGAYTYTTSIDRISEYSNGLLQMPRILPETLTATVIKPWGKRWDSEIDFLGGSHFLFQLYNALPPYNALAYSFNGPRKLNLSLGYTQPLREKLKLRIYSRLENLLNQEYFEDGFLTPGFIARGGLQLTF